MNIASNKHLRKVPFLILRDVTLKGNENEYKKEIEFEKLREGFMKLNVMFSVMNVNFENSGNTNGVLYGIDWMEEEIKYVRAS